MFKMKYSNKNGKGRVAPPKFLLHFATQTEKDRYILIEQSAHLVTFGLAKNWYLY